MMHLPRERALFAILLFAVIALATCSSCGGSSRHTRSVVEQHNATVLIAVECTDGDKITKRGMGSGVVVSDRYILTARHVIDCPAGGTVNATIDIGDNTERPVTVDLTLPSRDIARLEIGVGQYLSGFERPTLGPRPEIGERACEASAVPRWLYRCGEVQPGTPNGYIRVGLMAEFGNSGSAVYVDGKLVGLLVGAWACQGDYPCMGGVTPLQGLDWLIP